LNIKKLLKKKYIFLFATSFSGLFLNNFAEATVLNNSYKEVSRERVRQVELKSLRKLRNLTRKLPSGI